MRCLWLSCVRRYVRAAVVSNDPWLHGTFRQLIDAFSRHGVRDDSDNLKQSDLRKEPPGHDLARVQIEREGG